MNDLFVRTLYTPHYQAYQGVEEVIKRDIQALIQEHDITVWTPSENTTIEVVNGLAYGRTEIYRQHTPKD
jgi:hypothetical protein